MEDSPVDTKRARSRLVFVLVVHDPAIDASALCDELREMFIVREATTAFDALERLSAGPLACVVCVLGGAIGGADFLKLVEHASPEHVARLVFVDARAGGGSDFVRGTGASFLPSSDPKELLAIVGAVAARR